MKKWTIEDSKELYNINGWGTSYFGINDKGDVYVTPCKNNTQIDLREVPLYCCVFPIFLITVLKRHGAALRRLPKNTITRVKIT